MTVSEHVSQDAPQPFREAVDSLHRADIRPEISVNTIRPPQKLAPFSHAIGFEIVPAESELSDFAIPTNSGGDAFGRLILLHDPRGEETWEGSMRLVAYIQADMDAAVAEDPLLPQVAWQWLTESLAETNTSYTNLGGTVTTTNSVRYGDIGGPGQAFQLELRASWTAADIDLSNHATAFSQVLASVAGLPPVGVAMLRTK